MSDLELRGKAQTVLGLVDANDLGLTLPHEHLLVDWRFLFAEPESPEEKKLSREKVTLENLWFSRHYMLSSKDNMVLEDEAIAIREAKNFKKVGGKTIVEVTPIHIGRNPIGLVNVSKASRVNIIMGTAYYIGFSHTNEMKMDKKTEEDIAKEFIRDIQIGVGDKGIKAGIIGEIGCSWPMDENEKKVLRAAGIAQQETGAAISVHPGAHEEAPLEHIRILKEVGANINRVIMGHINRTFPSEAEKAHIELAETGCCLAFDQFGREGGQPASLIGKQDRVTDQTRIYQIKKLIQRGFIDQILVSHDVCFKHQQQTYGGSGFRYIPTILVAEMLKKGIVKDQINTILVENPKRMFSFT